MGCATSLVKYFVFFANLIFALAGLALVIIGVLYKVKFNEATDALPTDFGLAPILSIIIGAIVFVTAFLGCCGAVKESPCMLTTYAIILLTIFIVQVAIGVYAFLKIKDERQFHQTIYTGLKKPFDKYDHNEEARETVEVIQRLFFCCGFQGPDNYEWQNGSLPQSCCYKEYDICYKNKYETYKHDGCFNSVYNFIRDSSNVIGGTVICIAAFELLGAFFGLCLASSIKNQYRRSRYA